MSVISPKQQKLLEELKSRQLTHHLKQAGPDVKKTFEENFSQLVDTIVDEHFSRLKKYDLGFQLIDKAPDNTEALGVKAFRLRSIAFIPFIYRNGTVSGYDVIYLPKLNTFLPSTESWIVFLTTNTDEPLGISDDRFKEHYNKLYPNLLPLRRPITFKTASLNQKLLPKYLRKYAAVGKRLYAFIDKAPWLLEKIAKFYGPDTLTLIKESASREILAPKYIRNVQHEELDRKLRVYTEFQSPDEYTELNVSEREELFKRGFFVKDARDESEVSKAVPVLRKEIFFPVDTPGVYKVIDSEFNPITVLAFYLDNELCYISEKDNEIYRVRGMTKFRDPCSKESNRLYAVERVGDFKDSDWLKEVSPNQAHRESCVFDYTGKGYCIHHLGQESISQGSTNKIGIVSLPKGPGDKNIIVVLPKKCYIIPRLREKDTSMLGSDDYPPTIISPNILSSLSVPFETIKISYDHINDRYILNKTAHSRFSLLKSLIKDYGLREKTATEIIREAEFDKTARYWVKLAEPFELRQKDQPKPMFLEQPMGTWPGGYTTTTKVEADMWVPGLRRPQPIQNIMEPPPLEVLKKIKQLADSNDGEAFDLGLISSLLHTTNIDDYIPAIIKGLDGMCRILFVMYRHQEELKERYGDEDYKKIVEALKSSIENVGDLVVDLSQQKIDPYIRAMESEAEQAATDA